MTATDSQQRTDTASSFDARPPWWRRHKEVLLGLCGVIGVLAIWQLATSLGAIDSRFSSSPLGAFQGLVSLAGSGEIWGSTANTLIAVAEGIGITLAVGIPVGLITGRVSVLYGLFEPLISVMYAVPFVIFLPIIIFWFGIGDKARLVIIIWASIFPLLINVVAGARNLDRNYLQVSQVFCASRKKTLFSVALPGTMPYILAGIRQSVGRALVGAIVAELFIGSHGIGFLVQLETSNFEMDKAMGAIAVIAAVAILLTRGVAFLEQRLTFWSDSSD